MQFKKLPPYFPKQLYLRFVLLQVLGVVPAFLLALPLAHIYLDKQMRGSQNLAEVLPVFDRSLIMLGLCTAALVLGVALWTGYRLVLPLGRILVKARSIQKREEISQAREEDATAAEEPSEWSDLETTLHKIGRELRSKDLSLSRERGEVDTMMSALTEAVAAVDKTGTMLFFNSQFAFLFGRGDQASRLSDFIRSPDVVEAFRETLKDGAARQVSTSLRIPGETTPRFFSLSIAPLRQEKEELYGAIGVFHDLSELRRMDQVRIDFVANVSHELRTPLTSIKGYAQTLREDAPEGSTRKFLETIERNADRLIALVHDLLQLSSLESGAEMQHEQIDLKDLTCRVLQQLESLRAAKQHDISVVIETPKLWADPKRIEQVLFNLVENGIKYVPVAGKIRVAWSRVEGEVQLRVTDNGPGIPSEHHSRVFERFYRVDSARSREQGGTGLGLSIVKHIVLRHGGKIRVQSASEGTGADFLCTFPLERAG